MTYTFLFAFTCERRRCHVTHPPGPTSRQGHALALTRRLDNNSDNDDASSPSLMHPQGFPSPSSTNNIDDNNNAMMRRRRRRRVPTSRSPITIAIASPCKRASSSPTTAMQQRADDEDATTQQRRGRTLDERTSTSTQLDRARLCTPPPSSTGIWRLGLRHRLSAPVAGALHRPPPASGVWDSAGMRSDESYSMGGPIILLPSCLIWGWLNRCGRWRIFCLAWSRAHWIFKRDADTASELEASCSIALLGLPSTLSGAFAQNANSTSTAPNHTAVLILGGGMAGVIVARTLHERGIGGFIILDAQAGVQRTQQGNGPANPIWELALKHNLTTAYSDLYGSVTTFGDGGYNDYLDAFNDAVNNFAQVTVAAGPSRFVHVQSALASCKTAMLPPNLLLPSWKLKAINSIEVAAYKKIFLQFNETFWFPKELGLHAAKQRGKYPVWQSLDHVGLFPGSSSIFVAATISGTCAAVTSAQ
ncbi:hypothetical protein L210DRAFT_3765284 [Boletus edulis BED1]|uniref:Uncharacterized protein n=1 Tax=Boletus edulis BED1 TaxID=1328754 RepID=A0AAD4G7D2_BOLED|nr:hypothetical protein L210DRAFT_3765284 [Boletus edulis BED1]